MTNPSPTETDRRPRRLHGLVRILAVSSLTVLSLGQAAAAERHALLIGIGDYRDVDRLGGPRNDVEALYQELVTRWGFQEANVRTLIDAEATRNAILGTLDTLVRDTRRGDYVFLYYSGHGTSAFDTEHPGMASQLGPRTGALVPYDYDAELAERPTPRQWAEGLIVGDRDLRPRLERLDRDRRVFAVFDTCFSGYSVRSLLQGKVRWIHPPAFERRTARSIRFDDDPFEGPVFGSATAEDGEYPYENLIYLSAASQKERAEEVSARYSFDRRTHGALTHSLLKALRGDADTNRDGLLSYLEVYEFVREDVNGHHQQMPQILYPKHRRDLVESGVFDQLGSHPPSAPALSPAAPELRVGLAGELSYLARRVGAVPGVRLADRGDGHVELRRDDDGMVALYHASGDRIAGGFDDRRPWKLIDRLERQVRVQALIDLRYPRQDFTPSLHLPRGRGFLVRGERFEIRGAAERPVVFLLLNIDKAGTVSVLYPATTGELAAKTSFRNRFEVIPPFGTEYLKLFAFERPPERLSYWIHQKIEVLDPRFGEFLDFLDNPGVASAQTRLRLVTAATLYRGESRSADAAGR